MGKARKNVFDVVSNNIGSILLGEKIDLDSLILKLQEVRDNGADTVSFLQFCDNNDNDFEFVVFTEKQRLETDKEYEKRMYRESEKHRIHKNFVRDLKVLEEIKKKYPDLNINYNKQ